MSDSNERTNKANDESQWVKRFCQGDEKGFEALYLFYFPKLSQFVYRYVRSTVVAEDLIHNVFFTLWRNRENIKQVKTLRPYLYRAARNQALKHINRSNDDLMRGYPMASIAGIKSGSPDEILNHKELKQAVINAVQELPDKRRHIYLLHREDGLTYKEIAHVLDISIKTVETQMSRSLTFLRKYLADFLPVVSSILLMREWL